MIKITDDNRSDMIQKYVQNLIGDMPRYNLYYYAMKFLELEKSALSNGSLEGEILSYCPELLEAQPGEFPHQ